MKKQEEMRVSVVWFVIDPKGNIFSLEHSNQLTANIWTSCLFWGVYLSSIILSEPIHLVGSICFQQPMLLLKKKQKKKIKKTKNRNSGRFFLALFCCHSFSLDIRSFSSLFFIENKQKRSILNRKWAYSLLWQPFASALVQSWLFVPPQDSICRWRRKGRWMSAFWC